MLKSGWKTHKFLPFDPVSKRITATVSKDGKKYTCAKGAPNAILKLAQFDKETVQAYRDKAQSFATRGFRSLGVACQEEGKEWELLGMLCMFDPPRADTAKVSQQGGVLISFHRLQQWLRLINTGQTIQEARDLGIHVKVRLARRLPAAHR